MPHCVGFLLSVSVFGEEGDPSSELASSNQSGDKCGMVRSTQGPISLDCRSLLHVSWGLKQRIKKYKLFDPVRLRCWSCISKNLKHILFYGKMISRWLITMYATYKQTQPFMSYSSNRITQFSSIWTEAVKIRPKFWMKNKRRRKFPKEKVRGKI